MGHGLEGGVTVIDERAAALTAGQGHSDSQCFEYTSARVSPLHAFPLLTLHRGKWPIHHDKHNGSVFWHGTAFFFVIIFQNPISVLTGVSLISYSLKLLWCSVVL